MESMRKEVIDPPIATEYMKHNSKNRTISHPVVDKYTRAMANGHWILSNQSIGFDENGCLIDGQHRLLAVIKSGVSIVSWVARGLPVQQKGIYTQDVIDTLKVRSTADQLQLSHKTSNAKTKAAIVSMIVCVIKDTNKIVMSVTEAAGVIALYADEIDMCIAEKGSIKGLSFSPIIAALAIAAKTNPDEVIDFKEQYFKGIGLTVGSPALTLRNYMLNRSQSLANGSMQRILAFDYTTQALLHFINGTSLKLIKHTTKGTEYFLQRQPVTVKKVLELFNRLEK